MAKAANCQSCGQEYLDFQLTKVKLASFLRELNICEGCFNSDPAEDYRVAGSYLGFNDPLTKYKEAARILSKMAQEASEAEINGPQVRIEPMESLVDEAVKRLKQIDPNYFLGVSRIISGTETHYGHVSSDDPSVVHINFPRIKSEITAKMSGASQDDIDEAIINSIVETVSHERGHVKDFNPETNTFSGGEGAAHVEEQKINQQIK